MPVKCFTLHSAFLFIVIFGLETEKYYYWNLPGKDAGLTELSKITQLGEY